jgi:hypothetical protein
MGLNTYSENTERFPYFVQWQTLLDQFKICSGTPLFLNESEVSLGSSHTRSKDMVSAVATAKSI